LLKIIISKNSLNRNHPLFIDWSEGRFWNWHYHRR